MQRFKHALIPFDIRGLFNVDPAGKPFGVHHARNRLSELQNDEVIAHRRVRPGGERDDLKSDVWQSRKLYHVFQLAPHDFRATY